MRLNPANVITVARIVVAPLLVLLAWQGRERAFLALLICALVSDIVDGQIARRFHLATPLGAQLDSWADFLTAISFPFALYWLRPELILPLRFVLILALVSYLLPIAIGFMKFRRLTSYHTFMARVAAYLLGVSIIVLFAHGPTLAFQLSVAVLALSALEEIAITCVLRQPESNVRSLRHVLRDRATATAGR